MSWVAPRVNLLFGVSLPEDEVFTRLDAALTGLGYERDFTPQKMSYVRVSEKGGELARIEFKIESNTLSGSVLVTITDLKDGPISDFAQDLEAFLCRGQSTGSLATIALPQPPFLTAEKLISPYPRLPAKRRLNWLQRNRPNQPITFNLDRNGKIVAERFRLSPEFLDWKPKLRAFAHWMDWQEISSTENELVFMRGQETVQDRSIAGKVEVPAVLTCRQENNSKGSYLVLSICDWEDNKWRFLAQDFFNEEVKQLRAYLAAGIRPTQLVPYLGREASLRDLINVKAFLLLPVLIPIFFLPLQWQAGAIAFLTVLFILFMFLSGQHRHPRNLEDLDHLIEPLKPEIFADPASILLKPEPPWYSKVEQKARDLESAWLKKNANT